MDLGRWGLKLSKHPAPTREHHDNFCTTEDWALVRGATGKPVKHHRTYELSLWNGRILRTRISRPVDGSAYTPRMWSHIRKEQLEVTQDEFWDCVLHSNKPDRGGPKPVVERTAIPLHLYRLLEEIGVAAEEIATLDAASAARRLAEFYSAGE